MFADLSLDLSIVWTKHLTGLKFCISNSNKDFMIFLGTISLFPAPGNTGAKCPNLPPKAGKLAWWQPGTLYHDWLELGGCWGREEAELSGLWCWGWAVMDRHQPVLSVWTQHNSQSLSLSLAGQVAGDAQLGAGRVLAGIIIQYQSESLLSFQKVAALWLRLSRSWAELGYIVTTTRVTIFPRSVSVCLSLSATVS